jgi:hypothetical protein
MSGAARYDCTIMAKLLVPREQVEQMLDERIRAGKDVDAKAEIAADNWRHRDWLDLFAKWRDDTIRALKNAYEGPHIAFEFEAVTGTTERSTAQHTFEYRRPAARYGILKLESLVAGLPLALSQSPDARAIEAQPTGLERADRYLDKAIEALKQADHPDHFKGVGVFCREAIKAAAKAVYVSSKHVDGDDSLGPGPDDAKRQLNAFFATELSGNLNLTEAARKHARAAVDLASALTHKDTANYREALLTVEATRAVLNLASIVNGNRDRPT